MPVAGLYLVVSCHLSLYQLVSGRQQLAEEDGGLLLSLLVRGEHIAVLDCSAPGDSSLQHPAGQEVGDGIQLQAVLQWASLVQEHLSKIAPYAPYCSCS